MLLEKNRLGNFVLLLLFDLFFNLDLLCYKLFQIYTAVLAAVIFQAVRFSVKVILGFHFQELFFLNVARSLHLLFLVQQGLL